MNDIKNFLDENGRIKTWAAKKEMKLETLKYISTKFEHGRSYSEKEVNAVIDKWHTFGDYFLIRRELINNWFLSRTDNGARYWVEESDKYRDIIQILDDNYDIGNVKSIYRIASGYGSMTYYVISKKNEYIFKDLGNVINNPKNEVAVINELKGNNIPIPEIFPTKNGDFVLQAKSKSYHLQKYINGKVYSRNTAPQWLLYESARMLGRIQMALKNLTFLPIGISQEFFDFMTPERAEINYTSTLNLAAQKDDAQIIDAINSKIQMLGIFKNFKFDVNEMTCSNTHGDYKVQQIICGKDKINAIIDFSACIHPICWEVIRSYSLADENCIDGNIDIDNFKKYIACFLEYGNLNYYDLKIMPYVYYYQNLVSDYFGQYYALENSNKHILLDDAFHSVKLCKWFENNITRLEDALIAGF